MTDELRAKTIVETLTESFDVLMHADPAAFRRRFRRMAADPFAFYRGSAPLFYADVCADEDRWADARTSRVWIQGDLHAENFGTYLDGEGVLVFDVNDFDEAYLGHFTWDLRRFAASLALIGRTKALPDDDITHLVETYLRCYLDQVRWFVTSNQDHGWALRLDTADGPVHDALRAAQLATRVDLLGTVTVVDDHQRRFRHGPGVRVLGDEERAKVEDAYHRYLDTIPGSKRLGSITYDLKDVVGKSGFGIGSAGLPAYNLLVEGTTQALENDVVLTMKQGNVAAPSRVVHDERAHEFFAHHGHRTAVSQQALQAHADPWVGWTEIDGTGFVVSEFSPYERDLDWDDLTEPDEVAHVVALLGRATAKVHCVSDADVAGTALVDFQTEDAICAVVGDDEDALVADVVEFAHAYAAQVRTDHGLFVDAFRGGRIPGVGPSAPAS